LIKNWKNMKVYQGVGNYFASNAVN